MLVPCLLLGLPALLYVAMAAFVQVRYLPRSAHVEQARFGRSCRVVAQEIVSGAKHRVLTAERRDEWKKSGSVQGQAWGHFSVGDGEFVWVADSPKPRKRPATVRYVVDPDLKEPTSVRMLSIGLVVSSVFVLSTAVVGIGSFVTYTRARDAFMEATAHDLTTPLVGLSYMIGQNDAEAKILNERLLRIVANVRDFLLLGSSRARMLHEPVDLLAAYHEAYALYRDDYRDLFSGEDVALEAPDGPLWVTGDATCCVQILWNLLGNDLKYAAPFGRVFVKMRTENAFVRVDFVDEGPGMSASQRRRAFNRYFRAKSACRSGKGGFGIGLCTSREFARAMGGDLTVRANAPKGTVFSLVLPMGRQKEITT